MPGVLPQASSQSQVAGSLVVSRRVKLAEQPPGSLVVCASKHKGLVWASLCSFACMVSPSPGTITCQVIMLGGFKSVRSFVWHVQATIRDVANL